MCLNPSLIIVYHYWFENIKATSNLINFQLFKYLSLIPKGPRWQMCHFITFSHAFMALFFVMIFLKFLAEVGKWIKYMEKRFFIQNGLSIQKLWQETCFFAKIGQLLSMLGTRGKKLFFPNPCCQLLRNLLHMFS
jgi:hypothetical protein